MAARRRSPHALGDLGQGFHNAAKLRAYASAGVTEAWLVLAPEKQVEVHRQPQGEQYAKHAVHGPGGTLTSIAVPSLTVDLATLFGA